jgi:hypothetical protein
LAPFPDGAGKSPHTTPVIDNVIIGVPATKREAQLLSPTMGVTGSLRIAGSSQLQSRTIADVSKVTLVAEGYTESLSFVGGPKPRKYLHALRL